MTAQSLTRADLPEILQRALDLAVDGGAQGPVVLHLTKVAGYTDYALIVSARSDRHVGGITDAILEGLKAEGLSPIGSDGLEDHLWDLLDYDDFLIHVFYHPVRKHYDLESMWSDAPRVELGLPQDVMDTSALDNLDLPDPMPTFRGGSFGAFAGELDDENDEDLALAGELDDDSDDADDAEDPEDPDNADDLDEFADDDYEGAEFDDDDDDDDAIDAAAFASSGESLSESHADTPPATTTTKPERRK